MIHFSPELGWWSPAVFWYALINVIACLIFTVVVIIGGAGDLRYLFKSMREERIDDTDDGRVDSSEPKS